MRKHLAIAFAAVASLAAVHQAEARPNKLNSRATAAQAVVDVAARPPYPTAETTDQASGKRGLRATEGRRTAVRGREARKASQRAPQGQIGDPRPRAWCGWWLRHHLGVGDRAGNLARWWARYGGNAHGPAVGAIVVWPHHVGIITGRTESGWVVKSGNDGHAVRERERSLRGAIAFRWPNGMASR